MFKQYIKSFSKEQLTNIIKSIRYGHSNRDWNGGRYNDLFEDFATYKTFIAEITAFCKENNIFIYKRDQSLSHEELAREIFRLVGVVIDQEEETEDFEIPIEDTTDQYIHDKPYYFNEKEDEYIIQLLSKPKPMILSGVLWRSIVNAYSNWDGAPLTINQMCRKFAMSRSTMVELLKVMGMTHDSSPYTDEILQKTKEEDLVVDLLRRKEEKILIKTEQREYQKIQKDAYAYRNLRTFAKSIKLVLQDIEIEVEDFDYEERTDGFSVLVSPTDFHWGKYASAITGDEYNRDIARERLFSSTKDVLDRVMLRGNPDKIIVAIGGDGLHIDNQLRTTTRGTHQDCDGTPVELASSYVRLCIEYINMIRAYAPVECYVVAGNHDYYTTAILREAICAWFRNVKNVQIDEEISIRRTFLYGQSLITLMHGDNGSSKDFPSIIAGESAELWGQSKQRFIFTGHLHTERELPTFGNITVYRMPSLAGTDDWHWQKGYKSRKALIGYILDFNKGVIATEISPC